MRESSDTFSRDGWRSGRNLAGYLSYRRTSNIAVEGLELCAFFEGFPCQNFDQVFFLVFISPSRHVWLGVTNEVDGKLRNQKLRKTKRHDLCGYKPPDIYFLFMCVHFCLGFVFDRYFLKPAVFGEHFGIWNSCSETVQPAGRVICSKSCLLHICMCWN